MAIYIDKLVDGNQDIIYPISVTEAIYDQTTNEKLSDILNEKYSPDNPPPYPVTSVAGKTGAVSLVKGDVGLGNVDNVRQYSASNPPPYPVTSVNGQTGAVTIASYTLPIASATVLGGVKVGDGLKIDASTGVLSSTYGGTADNVPWSGVTGKPTTIAGYGITDASVNTTAKSVTIGGNTLSNLVSDADYVHTDNNFTTAEKNKLSGIATGAQVNVIESISVNGTAQTITGKGVNISVPTNNNQLTNGAGYITSAQAPVQSVNGKTGTVTLGAADVGAQATITGGATTITTNNLTVNRALISDGNGKVAVSTVTSTELGYLDGVTSAIQTQLNAKAPLASPALTGVPTAPTASSGTNTTQIATTAFVTNAVAQKTLVQIITWEDGD